MDQGLHQSLTDIITGVVIRAGKILLANVIENVVDTCTHLILRQGHGVVGVED